MSPNLSINPENSGELLLYQTEDGVTRVEARMVSDSVWLSLSQMADLFQRDKSVISRHISNIFTEGELSTGSVVANFATTAADGKITKLIIIAMDDKCMKQLEKIDTTVKKDKKDRKK